MRENLKGITRLEDPINWLKRNVIQNSRKIDFVENKKKGQEYNYTNSKVK